MRQPKYKLGDKLYYMRGIDILCDEVTVIRNVEQMYGEDYIHYIVGLYEAVEEELLFDDVEELKESLDD